MENETMMAVDQTRLVVQKKFRKQQSSSQINKTKQAVTYKS